MLDDNYVTLVELSDGELDEVSAGQGINIDLSHLVNVNVNVATEVANQIAVLSNNIKQSISQAISQA
jgi:uncharacterized alkaline shock family protein YloU